MPPPAEAPDAPTLTFSVADMARSNAPAASRGAGSLQDAATVVAPAVAGGISYGATPGAADDPFDGAAAEQQDEDPVEYAEGDGPDADAQTVLFGDAPAGHVPLATPRITATLQTARPDAEAPAFAWMNSASAPAHASGSTPAAPSGSHAAAGSLSSDDEVPWWERPVTPVDEGPEYGEAPPPVEAAFESIVPPPIPASYAPPAPPVVAATPTTPPPVVSYSPEPAHQGMQEIDLPAVPTVAHDYRPVGFQTGADATPRQDPPAPRPRPQPVPPRPVMARPKARRSPRQVLLVGGAAAAVAIAIGLPIVWRTMYATPAPVPAVHPYSASTAAPAAAAVAPPTFDDLAPPPTPKPLEPDAPAKGAATTKKKRAPAPVNRVEPAAPPPAPLLSSSPPAIVAAPQPVAAPVAAPPPTRVDAGPIGQIYELSQVDQKPQVTSKTDPTVPASLAGQRIEDVVILRVLVSAAGYPAEVRILRRARSGEALDAAAVAAVRRWTFSPARRKGQAVSCWYNVGMPFKN